MRGTGGDDGARTVTKVKGRTAGGRDTREEKILGLPRSPRCVAVSLTVRDGSGFTYREAMSIVRREIKFSELDINELRLRKAVTGAMLFEISGQDAGSKTSRLAERVAATLKKLPAKVTVPRRTVRMTELEKSVTPEEVAAAVAEAGGSRADEVTVGPIRYAPRGLVSVCLRCPLTAARKINRGGDARLGGKINIGWSTARATPLPARQLQCFRCIQFCPAWTRPRRDLIVEIGWDLSPPAILAALLASERGRRVVISFCEQVMLRKEAAERARVRSSQLERIDRQGRGRRRGHAWTRRSRAAAPPGGGQT